MSTPARPPSSPQATPPPADVESYEKLGEFYLGRKYDLERGEVLPETVLYDSRDLLTHALCVGMTGSGKTGLCISLLEEAAIDHIPALVIDPKGDLGNLLLTFPDLRPADFAPWIDPDEAARAGVSPEEMAAKKAEAWREGLARWGQSGERICRLREAAEIALYTPGSEAGLPVSILASLAAPSPDIVADADLLRDRLTTLVDSLLALVGIAADPVRREHVLLSNLFDASWRAGRSLDLAELIRAIQKPPFDRVGVLDLESFYPAADRFSLAMAFNGLAASPGFAAWLSGEPLDVGRLLHTATGKPRIAVFSIAHLSERERMFFVALLLNQVIGWMRGRPGTTSLRAILYMDEIFGFFPPVAEPPSKRPLLTLLKQARAYGLGIVLATQNPVDLDYKGLANIGTWFLGRLQTERDKQRVLDGLEGAAAGRGGFDRARLEAVLSALGQRVFLLHDVHEEEPVIFQTRWAMSYLRGPLTRAEVKRLMDPVKAAAAGGGAAMAAEAVSRHPLTAEAARTGAVVPSPASPTAPAVAAAGAAPAAGTATGAAAEESDAPPVLPPDVEQRFLPVRGRPEGVLYRPALFAFVRVHYADTRRGLEHSEEAALLAPLAEGSEVDWYAAEPVDLAADALEPEPAPGACFAPLPDAAARARSYASWKKALEDCLYRTWRCEVFRSVLLGELSQPGESERDFRVRLSEVARERRDAEKDRLRQKYAARVATLEERLRRAEHARQREVEQARQHKWETGLAIGSTVLGVLFGSRKGSTLGRAASAAGRVGRSAKEGKDVDRAEENIEAVQQQLAEVNAALETDLAALEERFDAEGVELETVGMKPRRTDVEVRLLSLAWAPYRRTGAAAPEPAWG